MTFHVMLGAQVVKVRPGYKLYVTLHNPDLSQQTHKYLVTPDTTKWVLEDWLRGIGLSLTNDSVKQTPDDPVMAALDLEIKMTMEPELEVELELAREAERPL